MEYTINGLSKIAKISARTLRYYDQIGLLKPHRVAQNGYRIYGQKQIDILQQILLYRELGVELEQIKSIVYAPEFDIYVALEQHLEQLLQRQAQISSLIENVLKTINEKKGLVIMADKEKFAGFKENLITKNEEKYGAEIRCKYGDDAVERSNEKIRNITKEQCEQAESLALKIEQGLRAAVETGNPAGEIAQKTCDLHREWLCIYYPEYSKKYHLSLAHMYVEDCRFKEFYDKIVLGGAEFLCKAIEIYCSD